AEQGRLATTGGPDQRHELTRSDVEVDLDECVDLPRCARVEHLRHGAHRDRCVARHVIASCGLFRSIATSRATIIPYSTSPSAAAPNSAPSRVSGSLVA